MKPYKMLNYTRKGGFPGGSVVKNPQTNAGDTSWISGLGTSHMTWSS